jgi:hypothetical protein
LSHGINNRRGICLTDPADVDEFRVTTNEVDTLVFIVVPKTRNRFRETRDKSELFRCTDRVLQGQKGSIQERSGKRGRASTDRKGFITGLRHHPYGCPRPRSYTNFPSTKQPTSKSSTQKRENQTNKFQDSDRESPLDQSFNRALTRRLDGRILRNDGPPNHLDAGPGIGGLDKSCGCRWSDNWSQAFLHPQQHRPGCGRRDQDEGGSGVEELGFVRQFWQVGICKEQGELCTAFPPFMWVLPSLPDSLYALPSTSDNLDSHRTRAIKGGWRVERRTKRRCAADMSHDATPRGIPGGGGAQKHT